MKLVGQDNKSLASAAKKAARSVMVVVYWHGSCFSSRDTKAAKAYRRSLG